jgi:O-antigen/teichoic acid export membrane protein
MTTIGQGGWILAARIAPQISGLALLLVGARFLPPDTLGRFMLAFAGVELLRRLARAGWREALIVDQTGPRTVAVATALALAGGLAAQAVTLAAALMVWRATWLGPEIALCIALMGFTLVPQAWSVVWEGLLLRRQRAAAAAWPLIAAEIVHLALGLILLAAGTGILALAWARVARALVLALGLGRAAGWPRALAWDRARAASILPLSGNVTASSLINYATSYGVDFIVGFYLGPASVAFFRIGSRITGALAEVVNETVRILAWTALPAEARRAPEDPARLEAGIAAFLDRTLVLVAPVYVGLALTAEPLVRLLLGAEWHPAALVIAVLALARLLSVPSVIAWPALALIGKSRYLPRLSGAIAGTALLFMVALGSFGLAAIAWSQALAALCTGIATMVLLNRAVFGATRLKPRADILAALVAMSAAMLMARALAGPGTAPAALVLSLGLQVLAGAATWLGFLRWRRREFWDAVAGDLRRRRAPGE